jgi:hypothetical protein
MPFLNYAAEGKITNVKIKSDERYNFSKTNEDFCPQLVILSYNG